MVPLTIHLAFVHFFHYFNYILFQGILQYIIFYKAYSQICSEEYKYLYLRHYFSFTTSTH